MTHFVYAVAGYVVILPDTALEKVFPLQDLATVAEPQHGLEGKDACICTNGRTPPKKDIPWGCPFLLERHSAFENCYLPITILLIIDHPAGSDLENEFCKRTGSLIHRGISCNHSGIEINPIGLILI